MKGGVGLCVLLFSLAIAGAQTPARPTLGKASVDNKYVGSMVCQDCHSEITDTFYRNPHNKSIVSQKELPERKNKKEGGVAEICANLHEEV